MTNIQKYKRFMDELDKVLNDTYFTVDAGNGSYFEKYKAARTLKKEILKFLDAGDVHRILENRLNERLVYLNDYLKTGKELVNSSFWSQLQERQDVDESRFKSILLKYNISEDDAEFLKTYGFSLPYA